MKKSIYLPILLFLICVCNTSTAQVFSPDLFQYEDPAAGVVESEELPYLYIQLNGAFRETAELSADNSEKINGSLIATIFKKGRWSTTIGYTLNKINENEVDLAENYFNSIIIPDFGGQSITLEGNYFFSDKGVFGLYGNFGLGIDEWKIGGTKYRASPGQVKLMATIHPLKNLKLGNDNTFNLVVRGGLSGRFLTSNLSSEKNLLMQTFNTDRSSFWGAELNLNLLFNDINLFFTPLWFFDGVDVEGFPTKGVYSIGVVLTGDFLKFQFQRSSEN
jgi:hypothetical protein